MNKKWIGLAMALGMSLLFSRCDNGYNDSDRADQQALQDTAMVYLGFSMGNSGSTKSPEGNDLPFEERCLDTDELITLANNGHLKAYMTYSFQSDGTTHIEKRNIKLFWTGSSESGRFVSEAMPFLLPQSYQILQFNIMDVSDPQYIRLLYAAPYENSPLANLTDPSCRLPRRFELTSEHLYKKTLLDICVYCVEIHDAGSFGFAKWDIEFIRVFELPFSVNICDLQTNNDQTGKGRMHTEAGFLDMHGSFVPEKDYGWVDFPASHTELSNLVFIDKLNEPDNAEYFRYTLHIGERTFVGVASVRELLSYKTEPDTSGWDDRFRYLHLWFCPGQCCWFFKEQPIP